MEYVNEYKVNDIWRGVEEKYDIIVRQDIKTFFKNNGGKHPIKEVIDIKGEEYEVRVFLSINEKNIYYVGKSLDYFLTNTDGQIIPVAVDSGSNYYCVNNKTGKVYYWSSEENKYYQIANNLTNFCKLFK